MGWENKCPKGDARVLREVLPSGVEPHLWIFPVVEDADEEYSRCLLFEDAPFCEHAYRIQEIAAAPD